MLAELEHYHTIPAYLPAYVQIQQSDVDVVQAPRPAVLDRLELIERTELERIQAVQHLDQLTGHRRAGVRQKSVEQVNRINIFTWACVKHKYKPFDGCRHPQPVDAIVVADQHRRIWNVVDRISGALHHGREAAFGEAHVQQIRHIHDAQRGQSDQNQTRDSMEQNIKKTKKNDVIIIIIIYFPSRLHG